MANDLGWDVRRNLWRSVAALALGLGLPACAAAAGAPPGPVAATSRPLGAVWDDPLRCLQAVEGGRRLARPPGQVRVGTWNVRWFPDGQPGNTPRTPGTDVAWMACVIAYLDVDLLGLQEIKLTERGLAALAELTTALRRLTGAAWSWRHDDCAAPAQQHVALLGRDDRVALDAVVSHGELDPTAAPAAAGAAGPRACSGRLRPGLGAYVRGKGGADFHFVTLHLDSGRKQKDFDNRRAAWGLLESVLAHRVAAADDADVVVAGDFNSMGCDGCAAKDHDAELAELAAALAGQRRRLVRAPATPGCTEYYRGHGGTIDLVLRTEAMQEAGPEAKVSGPCGAAACGPLPEDLPFFRQLSDHCPVVLDIADQDLD